MKKYERDKCFELMDEALRSIQCAQREWKKYEQYKDGRIEMPDELKEEDNSIEAEIALREFEYHRGYAEGINQVLVSIGVRHEKMKELNEIIH